jgi:hypothetical protein
MVNEHKPIPVGLVIPHVKKRSKSFFGLVVALVKGKTVSSVK